jgi:hypothetical protein
MNKRKFTLKTKILTGVGAGVIVAGAAAGASIAIYRASTSKDNDHIGDTDKADSLKQYKHDVLNKLAKKIYYLGYEKGLSDTQIKNNIVKQAGTLLNNVNKNVASLNQTQDLTDGEYSAIKQEAKKLGVDIFDNTASANSMNDSVSTYTNYLTQQDFSDSDIKTKTASFKNIWNNNLSASKDGLYDSFEFQKEFIMAAADQGLLNDKTTNTTVASEHFGIGKKLTSSKLKYTSFSNENGNGATTTLAAQMLSELGLSYIKSKSNEVLTVSVTPGFASNIIGYADTAQYEVGDEIESEDLSGLFTFSYDQVQGAILSDDSVNLSDIGVNVDELQPIEDSTEYDSSDSTMFAVNKNFTEYDGYGGTYRLAEFMPGFKLHTRIVSKDVDSKSQICHLELELGVSVLTSGGAYSEIL